MKLELKGVGLTYDSGVKALADVDLSIGDGERFAILGPSGSGKTSLLRLVAGLERPTIGEVCLGGEDCAVRPSHRRGVAMAFQTPALYPHRTVWGNLGFGLEARGEPKAKREQVIVDTASWLEISDLLDRSPDELSGGQRARVALGRALAGRPRVLLLDEPFAGLDAPRRLALRQCLLDLQSKLRFTLVMVTHDQDDATVMADRVAVLKLGRLIQVGTPSELFERPASLTVAALIGRPTLNLLPCRIGRGSRGTALLIPIDSTEEGASHLSLEGPEVPGMAPLVNRLLVAGIRPEHLRRVAGDRPDDGRSFRLQGRVLREEGIGSDAAVVVESCGVQVRAQRGDGGPWAVGQAVSLSVRFDQIHWFDPVDETRIRDLD